MDTASQNLAHALYRKLCKRWIFGLLVAAVIVRALYFDDMVSRSVWPPGKNYTLHHLRQGVFQIPQQRERLQRFSEGRKTLGPQPYLYPQNIFVDDIHRTLYCFPSKAGSTVWKHALGILSGGEFIESYPNSLVHSTEYLRAIGLRRLTTTELQRNRFDDYFKIMFVREPFRRLRSAYLDKYAVSLKDSYAKTTPIIIEHFRRGLKLKLGKNNGTITFEEFLQFVLCGWLQDPNATDMHWAPQYSSCRVFNVTYDFIGKMETFQQDAQYLVDNIIQPKYGISKSIPDLFDKQFGPNILDNTVRFKIDFSSASYANVSRRVLRKIQAYNKIDCTFFGYHCNPLYPGSSKRTRAKQQ